MTITKEQYQTVVNGLLMHHDILVACNNELIQSNKELTQDIKDRNNVCISQSKTIEMLTEKSFSLNNNILQRDTRIKELGDKYSAALTTIKEIQTIHH